jgi:RecB family exonuclease
MLRFKEELSPLERLALIDMSYSRLDTLQMCEAKYYFTYVLKGERVFGPAAALGNIVHGVLEKADLNDLDLDELTDLFDLERPEYDPNEEIDDGLISVGQTILEEFVDRHSGDEFDILGRELEFEFVIGSALFRGFIDRVDKTPEGGVHVIDYKTGKHQVAQKWAHQNLQLGLYALVCHKLYPDLWPIRGDLYYLRTGKMIGHTYTKEDLEWVEAEVLKTVQYIINNNNFDYTKNTRICSFCDFATNGMCKRGVKVRSSYWR